MVSHQLDHLLAHVVAVERVNIQSIEKRDGGLDAGSVVRQLSLPAGFVILNRVVWGVSAALPAWPV